MTPLWRQHLRHKWHKRRYLALCESSSLKRLSGADYEAPMASITASSMYENEGDDPFGGGGGGGGGAASYHYHDYPFYDDELYDPKVVAVAAGHKHSALLTEDGLLFTFGCGANGALGHGLDFSDQHWPKLVDSLRDEYIVEVSCGQNHTVCLSESGKVFTFGMGRYGQCGRKRKEAFMLQVAGCSVYLHSLSLC